MKSIKEKLIAGENVDDYIEYREDMAAMKVRYVWGFMVIIMIATFI